ncbi:hypothetical protein [Agromyces seonyuensis]|uniref:Uncharacterized protein n=1 Tax=Agromyces seonyuensis TaxID=2662446 RepID=A0A6I4NTL7_9MICO|nr:hypothetical protein [Agromyces seonyuensis]MWB97786.1 hypothetical protein [Agromyces seonyuensis]
MSTPLLSLDRLEAPAYTPLERVAIIAAARLEAWAVRRVAHRAVGSPAIDPARRLVAERVQAERERCRAEYGVLLQAR